AEAAVFDFAAVSVAMHMPFNLSVASLVQLAGWLADPSALVQAACCSLEPLRKQLLPAIISPHWDPDFSEEYFVFQFPPNGTITPDALLTTRRGWLAQLLRLETARLSDDEVAEALRLSLRYSPEDLFVCDWGAAVLLDHDCD